MRAAGVLAMAIASLALLGSSSAPSSSRPPRQNVPDFSGWESWWDYNKGQYLRPSLRGDARRVSEETIRGVIVPRLLLELQSEKQDLQTSSMLALARIGEVKTADGKSPIAEAIRPFLSSGSLEPAETAALALGILQDRGSIEVLAAVMANDGTKLHALGLDNRDGYHWRTRALAAYGLGLIGSKASNEDRIAINASLRKLLDGEGKQMSQFASQLAWMFQFDIQVACLSAMGIVPLAVDPSDDRKIDMKVVGAPKALASLQDQLRYLLAYYVDDSNDELIRAHAPTAMARLLTASKTPSNLPMRAALIDVFLRDLASRSGVFGSMQNSCALALGMLGDCDADAVDVAIRAALMRVKDESDDLRTRHLALIALAQVSGRAGHGSGDPIHGVRTEKQNGNSRSFLLNELSKGKAAARPWAGLALGVMERALEDAGFTTPPDSKTALRTALAAATQPSEVGALSIACGLIRDHEAKDRLLATLAKEPAEFTGWVKPDQYVGDPNFPAREFAAIGLGLMGDRTAIAPIREVVKQSSYHPALLQSIGIASSLLGDERLASEWSAPLASSGGLLKQHWLCWCLGFDGDKRSVEPLMRYLGNEELGALWRSGAVKALGMIADKDDSPWSIVYATNVNYFASPPTLTDQRGGILDIE